MTNPNSDVMGRSGPRRLEHLVGWARPVLIAAFWIGVVFVAASFVQRDALRYLDWSQATFQRFWPNRWLLAVHVAGASIALIIGPLQFSRTLRDRLPRVHRTIGWTYVTAVVITTPFAVRLSTYSSCELCVSAFVVWGSVTLVVTVLAVMMAVLQNFKAHREFMIRSYVLMYGFVFVRLDAHLLGTSFDVPLPAGVERNSMVIWLSWVVPLLVAELFVVWIPSLRRALKRPSRARAASV